MPEEQTLASRVPARLALESEGVVVERGRRRVVAPWGEIFGTALVPFGRPKKLFVLVPRDPPAPPWLEVDAAMVPRDLLAGGGLAGLADRIHERIAQVAYRASTPRRRRSGS